MPKSIWTSAMIKDLRKCAEVAKDKENEYPGLLFCSQLEAEWRKVYPRKKFSKHQLKLKYKAIKDKDTVEENQVVESMAKENEQKNVLYGHLKCLKI